MKPCSECRHDGEEAVCAQCMGHNKWEAKEASVVGMLNHHEHSALMTNMVITWLCARLGVDDLTTADRLIELLDQRLAEKSHIGTPAVIILREDEPPNVHELKDGEDLQQHAMQLAGDDGITEVIAVHILGRAEVPEPKPVWRAA